MGFEKRQIVVFTFKLLQTAFFFFTTSDLITRQRNTWTVAVCPQWHVLTSVCFIKRRSRHIPPSLFDEQSAKID